MAIEIKDINPNSWQGIATLRQRCEAQAADEGLAGVDLFFRGQNLFMESLGQFPAMRQKQAEARAQKQLAQPHRDPLRAALEAIRDGHNDPRSLAASVLVGLIEGKA